jgi:hypothetical protein
MYTRFLSAFVLAASLGFATAQAASVTDSSFYNTGGPGETNSTVPASPNFFGGNNTPTITASQAPAPATTAVDPTVFNTSGPGAVAAINPTGDPALGFGSTVPDVQKQPNLAATEPTDPTLYNTGGPGEVASVNPHLLNAGEPTSRYAQLHFGHWLFGHPSN